MALTITPLINADKVDGYDAGNSSGQVPVSNGTVNTNLNADMLDGKHTGTSGNTVPLLDGTNTWSAKQTLPASGSSNASLNIPHGTAPSSPTNGDIWTTTSDVYARINGVTYALEKYSGTPPASYDGLPHFLAGIK